MKKLGICLLLTVICSPAVQAKTTQPTYELVISHLPENIEMIKRCGNTVERQIVRVDNDDNTSQSSFHFHSVTNTAVAHNPNSPESGCTLTITSAEACGEQPCTHNIDFHTAAPYATVVKPSQTKVTP